MLCKHEVVGSIPSGSTSLRWLRQLRLGKPFIAQAFHSEGSRVVARKGEDGPTNDRSELIAKTNVRENITSHACS